MTLNQAINNKNFEQEFEVITINNDKPVTFTENDYKLKDKEGDPTYTNSDEYGRSGTAIAVLSKNTLAVYTSKNISYPTPKNWSKVIEQAGIYNKSHIIGYSLSAKNATKDNIFIGTEYLNQLTMKSIENEIYSDIKDNNRMYLYKVTPQYYKEDIVPFGVLIEAETIDKLEKNTLCRFCYNIQDGAKINYYDGGFEPIEKVYGTRVELVKQTRNTNEENNKYREYYINIKTKMFHLMSQNCSYIKNVNKKYIQETKANKDEIVKKGFKLCKKCVKK